MSRCHTFRFLAAIATSLAFTASVRCEQPSSDKPQPAPAAEQGRTDLDGNPLPPGAIARMGTVRAGHEVWFVAFAPDGKTLATASEDKTVRLWDAASGKEIRILQGHQNVVYSLVYSPDGKTLASAGFDSTARLWDAVSGKEIHQLRGHEGCVYSVAYAPDGKTLASTGEDNTVRLWEVSNGKEVRQFQGHQNRVLSVVFSPNGKTLATASKDNTVRLWEAATGKEIWQFQGHQGLVLSVAFSPDGKTLASASADQTVRLWEVSTGKEIRQFQGHQHAVYSVVFSPDGKAIASASQDKTVLLWETASGKQIGKLQAQQGEVFSVAFSPDSRTLASAGRDATILVWQLSEIYCGDSSTAKLDPKQLEDLWTNLADKDAAKAYRAIGTLILGANEITPFLQKNLQPEKASVDPQCMACLLADLDNDEFAVREKASKELARLGELALPALQKALAGDPSPEVRYRVESLLEKFSLPTPEQLRTQRAIMVLEQIGTPEAKQLIENLAKGSEGALLTEEAKAARQRMKP